MSWLNELYYGLLQSAVRNTPSTAQKPVSIRIVYPPRIGTLTTRLPGGGVQTAEVVIPGCVDTLVVAEAAPLPSAGGAPSITASNQASAPQNDVRQASGDASGATISLPENVSPTPVHSPYVSASESAAYPPSPNEHMASPVNLASSDASQSFDPLYASHPLPPVSHCRACPAAGTWGWCDHTEQEPMPLDQDPEFFPDDGGLSGFPAQGVGAGLEELSLADSAFGAYPDAAQYAPNFYSPHNPSSYDNSPF